MTVILGGLSIFGCFFRLSVRVFSGGPKWPVHRCCSVVAFICFVGDPSLSLCACSQDCRWLYIVHVSLLNWRHVAHFTECGLSVSNPRRRNVISYGAAMSACERAEEWQLALSLLDELHTSKLRGRGSMSWDPEIRWGNLWRMVCKKFCFGVHAKVVQREMLPEFSEGFWLLSFSVYFHFKSSDSLQKKLSGVTTMTTSLQRKTRFHPDVPSSWLEPHIDQADFDLHQATWSRITHASAPVRKQGNGKRLLDCFKRSWNICRQILLGRGDLWWVMNDLWWFMILWWFYFILVWKKIIVSFLQLESQSYSGCKVGSYCGKLLECLNSQSFPVAITILGLESSQWEFQDPKMEVLYHIRPYFGGIFPYIGLTYALYMVGTSNLGSWNGHWSSPFIGLFLGQNAATRQTWSAIAQRQVPAKRPRNGKEPWMKFWASTLW